MRHILSKPTTARSINRMLYCVGEARRAERCSKMIGLRVAHELYVHLSDETDKPYVLDMFGSLACDADHGLQQEN